MPRRTRRRPDIARRRAFCLLSLSAYRPTCTPKRLTTRFSRQNFVADDLLRASCSVAPTASPVLTITLDPKGTLMRLLRWCVCVVLATLLGSVPAWAQGNGKLQIHFLDVGQ